jgi:hypothetical protein
MQLSRLLLASDDTETAFIPNKLFGGLPIYDEPGFIRSVPSVQADYSHILNQMPTPVEVDETHQYDSMAHWSLAVAILLGPLSVAFCLLFAVLGSPAGFFSAAIALLLAAFSFRFALGRARAGKLA